MGGNRAGAFNAKMDGHGVSNNTKWSTQITKKGNKSLRSACKKDGQNKKPRSDDKDSGGEESKQRRKGFKEEVGQGDFAVDLELMSASLKKKSLKIKAAKKKADKKKQEDSAEKTTRRKKKAAFAPEPDKAGEEKDKEEVAICFKCVVRFAICIDRGNNAKGGFDKKISEGLAFL